MAFNRILYVEVLSMEYSKKRNILAHVKKEYSAVELDIWSYLVTGLEFICVICILAILGFTNEQISKIFYGDKIPKLSVIHSIISYNV